MKRTSFVVAVALAAALGSSGVPTVGAQSDEPEMAPKPVEPSEYGSYVVVMQADPLVVTEGRDNLDTGRARGRARQLLQSHDAALAEAGVSSGEKVNEYVNALNGFSATLTHAQATKLAGANGVAMVVPDELLQATTDSSGDFLGLDGPGGPWSTGYDGEGVVVGVIDTGIWPEHPSFADDGSYDAPELAGSVPCEFGNTAHNPNDAAFACNNKLVGARQTLATYRAVIGAADDEFDSARDDNGHGTHTASTAAGNADVEASIFDIPRGTISGVAPRAHVIAYKGLGNLGGFTSDLAAAIDFAVADGVDVINYSIGGGAAGPGADELAFLFAADAGVFVATSAGNSGPGDGTVGNPGTMPWLTTVGASTQPRFFEGTVVLGNGDSYTGATITPGVEPARLVDAEDAGNELCDPAVAFTASVEDAIVLCARGAVGRAAKSLAVFNGGGIGMVMYNPDPSDNLFTDNHWVPSVHTDPDVGLAIKAYIDDEGDAATAEITDTTNLSTWEPAPSMTIFSSRGPNVVAPDIIKPDITAPGLQILAGASPFPDPGSTPPGELFQAIAGTSMSSPHVAGVYALIKQAHPDWSPAAAKSAIMTTAYQDVLDNDRESAATPFEMGAGHIDPGNRVNKGSAFQPGLVYDTGLLDYFGFLCDAFPSVFATPAVTCGALEAAGISTEAHDLNLASIGVSGFAGTQTITRTVTSVAPGRRTFTVSIDAPDGHAVTVSPSSFTLKPGQSATYEVTIANESAPLGVWQFGSLTWRDTTGHYDVYSPIAVNPAMFAAPDEVTGSGESGSLSFDVSFGYTGPYSAAAHGLEPATVTSDNVVQDPNQTFDPSDGYSNAHQFTLSDAAFFRVAIPPEATEADADLDVFVYDPSGVQVASSTAPGTDEVVSITDPANGTWTVYIHGWAAPGGDSDYDLSSWVISATPGATLTVDGEPTSATIATVGTVDVSWTGATAGQWHLGAVSHTGPSGVMGLTLVEVDNR
jgi:subtilisin family serine protease